MTVELITGHAGSAHVSSADAGWLNAGTFGTGKYVLDTQTKFACNVQSANLVTVGTGDAVFEGRHVRVSATENVSIDNGAQGVNRNDIVCIKYEYDNGTSEESASLAVVKGTAVSGTPSDPTIPSGSILSGSSTAYMPLWRIPISGITVGTPEKMYGDVIVTLNGLLSKVWTASQIPNIAATKITSGTLDAARIPNLDASKIASGTLAAARIPSLDSSKITSGTLGVDRIPTLTAAKIPSLDASKITSGTFAVDRIPTLTAAKIPSIDASKLGSGTVPVARLTYVNWTYLVGSASASFYVRWCKVANIVHVQVMGTKTMSAGTAVTFSSTAITSGNRPTLEADGSLYSGEDHIGVLWVDTGGLVKGKFIGQTQYHAYGSLSYPVI